MALNFIDVVQISTSNLNNDGTGSITLLSTGTTAGKRITNFRVKAINSTPNGGKVNIYYSPDGGATKLLYGYVLIDPMVSEPLTGPPVQRVATFQGNFSFPTDFVLIGASQQIYVSTFLSNVLNIFASGTLG